jgi:hypothetical protein
VVTGGISCADAAGFDALVGAEGAAFEGAALCAIDPRGAARQQNSNPAANGAWLARTERQTGNRQKNGPEIFSAKDENVMRAGPPAVKLSMSSPCL